MRNNCILCYFAPSDAGLQGRIVGKCCPVLYKYRIVKVQFWNCTELYDLFIFYLYGVQATCTVYKLLVRCIVPYLYKYKQESG